MTNEEVFCFDMFGPFRTGDIAILRQRKSAHIVLVDDIGLDFVALVGKKADDSALASHSLFDDKEIFD